MQSCNLKISNGSTGTKKFPRVPLSSTSPHGQSLALIWFLSSQVFSQIVIQMELYSMKPLEASFFHLT